MQIQEMATEIVKTAIEHNVICFDTFCYDNYEESEKRNAFNSKQLSDFYKAIVDTLKTTID